MVSVQVGYGVTTNLFSETPKIYSAKCHKFVQHNTTNLFSKMPQIYSVAWISEKLSHFSSSVAEEKLHKIGGEIEH